MKCKFAIMKLNLIFDLDFLGYNGRYYTLVFLNKEKLVVTYKVTARHSNQLLCLIILARVGKPLVHSTMAICTTFVESTDQYHG